MEYALTLSRRQADLGLLEREIQALDPAAMMAFDATGATLRIATVLPRHALLQCLGRAALAPAPDALRQLPSVCCGSCSS